MLDRKFIVENAELVKQNCVNRGVGVDVGRFVELDNQRKAKQTEVEELNRQANEVSKSIGKAKDQAERDERKQQGQTLRQRKQDAQVELDALAAELDVLHRMIPNLSHPDSPIERVHFFPLGGIPATTDFTAAAVARPQRARA